MTETEYYFFQLPEELLNKYGFEALPFPVDAARADRIFQAASVSLDAILDELDRFLAIYPLLKRKYAANAAKLAMICATNHVASGDFLSALANLNAGLRIYPEHRGMTVHQAFALQLTGYHGAAAVEYERLLGKAPQAYDPLLRSLASKAFLAIDQYEKAFMILDYLPEKAFNDESLANLRRHILDKLLPFIEESVTEESEKQQLKVESADAVEPVDPVCPSCGKGVDEMHNFCPFCAVPLKEPAGVNQSQPQLCSRCGNKLKLGNKFCTQCGRVV